MKSIMSLSLAIFVFCFILSADLFAEKEWEKRLKADGWVRLKETLTTLADTTRYAMGVHGDGSKNAWVLYISPDGKEVTYRDRTNGLFDRGVRRQRKDGFICTKWNTVWDGREFCLSTWKKGQVIRFFSDSGIGAGTKYKMKQGNTEKRG